MGYDETQLDVLQNMEYAIVSVYRDYPDALDYAVMGALDALIAIYRAEYRGHIPKQAALQGMELEVFERVKDVCEWRMGRVQESILSELEPESQKSVDVILGCLRKIRKSVGRWNGRLGQQGYLGFVSNYV